MTRITGSRQTRGIPTLEDLEEIGYAKAFMAHVDYPTFLKEYYTAGNVLKIRDHMMITLVLNHSKFDEEFSEQLNAVGFYDERDYKNRLRNWTLSVAGDTLIPEYHQRYLNDANMQSAEGLLQDIKLTLKAIITDSDWLTLHGKELAKRKISKMKCCLWENGNRDELSDVTFIVLMAVSFALKLLVFISLVALKSILSVV